MTVGEEEFLGSYDVSKFERPSVTVDLVLMTTFARTLRALVVHRRAHPAMGAWALPGSFVGLKEDLDAAAQRVLREKAHIASAYLEQLYTFGSVDRDPRTRIITVVYFALLPASSFSNIAVGSEDRCLASIEAASKSENAGKALLRNERGAKLRLAFDHAEILDLAVRRLRGKLDYSAVAFELLPPEFTLRQLQEVHEAILGAPLNKPAFRRRMLDKGVLKATGRFETGASFRPAELYVYHPPKHHSQ